MKQRIEEKRKTLVCTNLICGMQGNTEKNVIAYL